MGRGLKKLWDTSSFQLLYGLEDTPNYAVCSYSRSVLGGRNEEDWNKREQNGGLHFNQFFSKCLKFMIV